MKKTLLISAAAIAVAAGAPAIAQQFAPVLDREAAAACRPDTLQEAIVCLDRHLKPEVKQEIADATIETLAQHELYVGLWVRNNWGLWTGSNLSQWFVASDLPQVERMSQRVIDAYWLHTKGCSYDWSNLGFTVAAIDKAVAGQDPCSVTVAEADATSMSDTYHFTLPGQTRGGGGGRRDFNPNEDPDAPQDEED